MSASFEEFKDSQRLARGERHLTTEEIAIIANPKSWDGQPVAKIAVILGHWCDCANCKEAANIPPSVTCDILAMLGSLAENEWI